MNQTLKREIELAQYAALKGDAKLFFIHGERIFSMDIHNDEAPVDLLNKLRLIAALRADKFKTATESWDAMKGVITKKEKMELWNHLLSSPEISDSDYVELIRIIVGDPNQKSALLTNKMIGTAITLMIIILGGGIIWVTDFYDIKTKITSKYFAEDNLVGAETTASTSIEPTENPIDAVQLFEDVSPSVVMFVNVCDIQLPDGTFRQWYFGHGSGFVIDSKGTVITNKHVVDVLQENVDDMNNIWSDLGGVVSKITLYGLVQKPEPHAVLARVIFKAPDIDLAVVEFLEETNLSSLQLADQNPKVGSDVVVIGYRGTTQDVIRSGSQKEKDKSLFKFATSDTSALVDYMWSPGLIPSQSDGKISSIFPKDFESDRAGQMTVLESSAMCNHGNSGGPMFDMHKNVVGMLTWGLGSDSAVNLCISIETINMILEEWRESKK
ncbi:trypsin-like peptidase domain-containing protein [PVC group bacterium]|nr:trypsin-like peptidase domain-containing protein [PVC group bacterium]